MPFGRRAKAESGGHSIDAGVGIDAGMNRDLVNALENASAHGLTGCLAVTERAHGTTGRIYFYAGEVYSVLLDDYESPVLERLVSAGTISADVATEARDAASVETWLVEHQGVDVEELGRIHQEISLASLTALLACPRLKVKVHDGDVTDRNCCLPLPVEAVLETLALRRAREHESRLRVGAQGSTGDLLLDAVSAAPVPSGGLPEFAPFLAEVDGTRSLDDIARRCGFTRAEALHLARLLILQGSVRTAGSQTAREIDYAVGVPEEFGTRTLAPRPSPVPAVVPVPDAAVVEDDVLEDDGAEDDVLEDHVLEEGVLEEGVLEDHVLEEGVLEDDVAHEATLETSVFAATAVDFTLDGSDGDESGLVWGEESSDELPVLLQSLSADLEEAAELNRRAAEQVASLRDRIARIEALISPPVGS